MTDAAPDYPTLTGAQFRRAVGVDADKWAAAFVACGVAAKGPHAIADWFADAMVAAAVEENWGEDIGSHSRTDPRAGD
jgi:hypothetical protein